MAWRRSAGSGILGVCIVLLGLVACTPSPAQTFVQGTWYYNDLHLARVANEQHLEMFWVFAGDAYQNDSCCFNGETFERGNYRIIENDDGSLVLELYNRQGHVAGMVLSSDTAQIRIAIDEEHDTLKIGQAVYTRYTDSELAIASFTATPNPIERGEPLTLTWSAPGATRVTLRSMSFDRKTGTWSRTPAEQEGSPRPNPMTFDTATGKATVTVPGDARNALRFELEAVDATGARVTATSPVINLVCHTPLVAPGFCPFPEQTVPAITQPFEHGRLIWREDTREILILSTNEEVYVSWRLEPAIPAEEPLTEPPAGLYAPGARFAGLWSRLAVEAGTMGVTTPEVRTLPVSEILGWATGPEEAYTMTLQLDLDNTQSGVLYDHLMATLPDGQVLVLTLYGGAEGKTGPTWRLEQR